jgi:hypothetical protein
MFFSNTAIFSAIACLLTQGQAATVGERALEDFKVISSSQVGNETLTWFGAASPSVSTRSSITPLDVGCGTNTIKCSDGHAYYGPTCQTLIYTLRSDYYLSQSPRAVCLGQGDRQCCISWSKEFKVAPRQTDLAPAAEDTLSQCGMIGKSGQEWNVMLGQVCVSQCLSNRPGGCK